MTFCYDVYPYTQTKNWITSSLYNLNMWQLNAITPYQSGYLQFGNLFPSTQTLSGMNFLNPYYFNPSQPMSIGTFEPTNLLSTNLFNYSNNRVKFVPSSYKNSFNGRLGVLNGSSIFSSPATDAVQTVVHKNVKKENSSTHKVNKPEVANVSYNAKNKKDYKKINNQVTIQEDLRSEFLTTASQYMGCNEKDGSWRKISNSKEWCADFITHVVNETYNDHGYSDLKGFNKKPNSPHMRVEEIKQWGIDNDKYLDVSKTSNEASSIKRNVEKGDIMILRENGASHTGFVQKVYSDGSFLALEGNRKDKVTTHKYQADDKRLSGFVQLA